MTGHFTLALSFTALPPIPPHTGKVYTINFELPESSPRTFTVQVQLSAFHYLTAS